MQTFFSDFYTIQPFMWENISRLTSAMLNGGLSQLLMAHANQSSTAFRLNESAFWRFRDKRFSLAWFISYLAVIIEAVLCRNTDILPSHGDTWKLVKRQYREGSWWSSSLNKSQLSLSQVYRAFNRGYSLVLNKIQHSSPNIRRIVNILQPFFGHKVNANLYITPGGSHLVLLSVLLFVRIFVGLMNLNLTPTILILLSNARR